MLLLAGVAGISGSGGLSFPAVETSWHIEWMSIII